MVHNCTTSTLTHVTWLQKSSYYVVYCSVYTAWGWLTRQSSISFLTNTVIRWEYTLESARRPVCCNVKIYSFLHGPGITPFLFFGYLSLNCLNALSFFCAQIRICPYATTPKRTVLQLLVTRAMPVHASISNE
jgi:hypothetical protein